MTPYLGNAGFSWDNGESTLRTRTPMRDFRVRHQRARMVRESLDKSVREVTTIGTGVNEVRAMQRFEDDPGGLMDLLRAGADGGLIHYHHRNWLRYSGMYTDTDGNGVVDDWTGQSSGGATFSLDVTTGVQKIVVSGTVAVGSGHVVQQTVHSVAAGESWCLSWYVLATGLANCAPYAYISWLDSTGATISTDVMPIFLAATRTRKTFVRTAPANTAKAAFAMGILCSGSSVTGTVLLDNAQAEIAAVATSYLPSYPCYLISPSGEELETDLDSDRGSMGEHSVEMVLRAAISPLDFRLLASPGT
jgi:hypothetical protein